MDDDQCAAAATTATLHYRIGSASFQASPDQSAELRAGQLDPVRRPPSYKGMRNYIGCFPAQADDGSRWVWFESLNELAHLRDLVIANPRATLATQPFLIEWSIRGRVLWHVPDILVERPGQAPLAVDVTRSEQLLKSRKMAVNELTAETLAAAGWDYELRTEMPRQRVVNLSHLWAVRTASEAQRAPWLRAVESIRRWPTEIRELVHLIEEPNAAMAALHLVARGDLFLDLDSPLRGDTVINREPLSKEQPPWKKTL